MIALFYNKNSSKEHMATICFSIVCSNLMKNLGQISAENST